MIIKYIWMNICSNIEMYRMQEEKWNERTNEWMNEWILCLNKFMNFKWKYLPCFAVCTQCIINPINVFDLITKISHHYICNTHLHILTTHSLIKMLQINTTNINTNFYEYLLLYIWMYIKVCNFSLRFSWCLGAKK